jgi:ATP-dependent Clp protease, protease subunit
MTTRSGPALPGFRDIRAADQPGPAGPANPIYNRLLEERIIVLGSEVRDDNANEICGALLLLAAQSEERDIWLYINSPGGSVTAGMAVYDTMQFIKCDISTVVMGLAASMGQFLLSAGTKGKRYALPHARVMMHQPSGGMGGSATDIKIQAEQLLLVKRQLAELTADHTGQPVEQIEADADRDRWFTAEQAREYGLVDHVMSRSDLRAVRV